MACPACGEPMQPLPNGNGVLWLCKNGHTQNS
jgi:hypothetical protein